LRRAVFVVVFALIVLIDAPRAFADRVIPPGRESEVMALLGADTTLPDHCRLDGASIEGSRAIGRYLCDDGTRQVTLAPPRRDAPTATASFSVRFDPAGHDAFETAIVANVRAHEAGWTWLASSQTARTRPPHLATRITRGSVLGWSIVWLLFTAALAAIITRAPVASRHARADEADRRAIASLVAVAVLLFALVRIAVPAAPAHADSARDLLLAIDCHARGCVTGPSTTAPGLQQGTLWPRTLGLLVRAGLGPTGAQTALLASYVIGAFVLALAWRRTLSARGAFVILCGAVSLAIVATEAPVLWGPSLAPFPLFAGAAALLVAVDAPAPWWGAIVGFGFAAAAESHVVCVPLVFVAPAVLFATARNPLSGPLALVASIAPLGLASPGTWSNDAHVLSHPIAATASLTALVVTALLRPRIAQRGVEQRLRIAIVAFAAPSAAISVGAFALAPPGTIARFALPALPALVLMVGALAASMPSAAPFTFARTALALVALAPLARRAPTLRWSLRDAQRIAAALSTRGIGWAESRDHLAVDDELRAALAPWDPRIGRAPHPGAHHYAVLRLRRGATPAPGSQTLSLDDGTLAAITPCLDVIDSQSWRVCGDARCEPIEPPDFEETVAADRAYPSWPSLADRTLEETLEFRVGLRPRDRGEFTIVSADDRWQVALDDGRPQAGSTLRAPWPPSTEIRAIRTAPIHPRWPAPLCVVGGR
jgi:hypothetical protein